MFSQNWHTGKHSGLFDKAAMLENALRQIKCIQGILTLEFFLLKTGGFFSRS